VYSSNPADGLTPVHQRLLAILQDPWIKRLALRHAGHAEVAEDALQSTYYAVARLESLEQIENLRAYFCKVLIREVHRERGQLGAALVEDFARVVEARQDAVGCRPASPSSVDDAVCTSLQAQVWLERFVTQRDRLRAEVPARSDEPDHYRAVVCDGAGQVLRDGINGEPSDADSNDALRAAYPEYFAQPGASLNTLHQRFSRARADVRALLQAVVSRNELT
jgi:DNA-directed RNA polymerase specialized sigma24 family protein